MNDLARRSGKASSEQAQQLVAEGEQLIAQSRAIRALLVRLIAQGDEHQKRMLQFKDGRDLNRAEAAGDLLLGTLLYRVCREGETLRELLELFHPTRGART